MLNNKTPSDLLTHLGYWLRIVSNAVSQSFARKLETQGVTVAEWVFLRILYDVEGIAPSLLAKRMGMTKGAISKLADRLIEKNLVTRTANQDSKRGQGLMLNSEAKNLVPLLAELADQNDSTFFEVLTPDERQQLEEILKKIVRQQKMTIIPIN